MIQAIDEARSELEMAQKTLDAALKAWDESVAQLYRTSLALTQAQKRVTRAHELLREALDEAGRRPLFLMSLSIHTMSESVFNGAAILIAEVYNCLDSIRARMSFLNQDGCSIDGEYDSSVNGCAGIDEDQPRS